MRVVSYGCHCAQRNAQTSNALCRTQHTLTRIITVLMSAWTCRFDHLTRRTWLPGVAIKETGGVQLVPDFVQ